MNVVYLFSTKERIILLERILSAEPLPSLSKLASELGISKGLVSPYVRRLESEGIIKDGELVLGSYKTRALKLLLNLDKIDKSGMVERAHSVFKGNQIGIGLYGSWAKGTNTESSDVDIWIMFKEYPGVKKVAEFTSYAGEKLGVEVSAEVLYEKKLSEMKKANQLYFDSLVFGSILLWGDEIGA